MNVEAFCHPAAGRIPAVLEMQLRRTGFLALLLAASGCGSATRPPSVLLVILDTVAAGHVGYCGYGRETTPVLDSLAAEGAAFLHCQAQSPWTLPSCASILTGLNVRSHGIRRYSDGRVTGVPADLPTLQSVLNSEGYATAGFMNNYLLGEDFGWHQGFDSFQIEYLGLSNAGPTVDSCLVWMEGLDNGEPYFALVHIFDAHDPYEPPPPFDTRFGQGGPPFNWDTRDTGAPPDPALREHLIDLYDGDIANVDYQLGRLVRGMEDMGLAENTIVVVVADHGEEFLERGQIWHGKTLNQEVLHVPLVIAGPGIAQGEYSGTVGQVDIAPTLAALLGVDWPGTTDGIDLLSRGIAHGPVFSENLNSGPCLPVSVLTDSSKTIWDSTVDAGFTFDLRIDPAMQNPLPPDGASMDQAREYWATPVVCHPISVNRDHVDAMLRDLGYI
jgi:arylsulfatase A-like enzyme